MPFASIATLTDAQIFDVYFHPRDKEGKPVERTTQSGEALDVSVLGELPDTPENQRAAVLTVGGMLGIPQEQLRQALEEAERRRQAEAQQG